MGRASDHADQREPLTTIEPKARAFLVKEMEKFFFRRGVGEAQGVRAEGVSPAVNCRYETGSIRA